MPAAVVLSLTLLWLSWAALLLAGWLVDFGGRTPRNRIPLAARMAMSALLTAAALIWWFGVAGAALGNYGLWIVAGMALGFAGDLVLASVVRVPSRFIVGMALFGAGHLCYIAAFFALGRLSGAGLSALIGPIWLALGVVSVLLWYTLVREPGQGVALNAATLGYTLLLAAMSAAALSLASQETALAPLAVGSLLFMASDTLVGSERMRGTAFRSIGDVIWTTYTVAQMLIVYSTAIVVGLA